MKFVPILCSIKLFVPIHACGVKRLSCSSMSLQGGTFVDPTSREKGSIAGIDL